MTDPLLLVTGFGPYEDVEENPSGRLVERLDLDPPAGVEIAALLHGGDAEQAVVQVNAPRVASAEDEEAEGGESGEGAAAGEEG